MNSNILIPAIAILIIIFGTIFYYLNIEEQNQIYAKNYIGHTTEECERAQITCVAGFRRFDDNNGCGCEAK